jgi:GDPmannose 4,6-dehydratase
MLQQEKADDYVVGTGKSYSVRDFVEKVFDYVGIKIKWEGSGVKEKGVIDKIDDNKVNERLKVEEGNALIEIDPNYFRPTETEFLQADIAKAKEKLNWEPRTNLEELVKIMVDYDMKIIGLVPVGEGIKISKEKGFKYTNHDFSFYGGVKERD